MEEIRANCQDGDDVDLVYDVAESNPITDYAYDSDDCLDWKDDDLSAIILDDNGFPATGIQNASGGERVVVEEESVEVEREIRGGDYCEGTGNGDPNRPIGKGEDSFASDFYRCGSDWSALCSRKTETPQRQARFRQTNLLQMWGRGKTENDVSVAEDEAPSSSSSSLLDYPNKKSKVVVSSSASSVKNNAFLLLRPCVASETKTPRSKGVGKVAVGNGNSRFGNKQKTRPCPFYKKMPGTPFTVDAFRYGQVEGCKAYFLSHFHADHYGGLTKGWSAGPIYCTPITARLVRMCLYIDPQFINPLEFGEEYVIEGIKVTMLDANHCPGAALIHFSLPSGQCYLHTGDFRASKEMQSYPLLVSRRVNVLYLDTTYCNPKYRFPSKEEVLNFVVRVTQNCLRKQPKTLIVVGAYSIGKECVYLAISQALGVKVFANAPRRRVLQSFGWPELSGNLCMQGTETPLHVQPMSSLKFEVLDRYLKSYVNKYTAVLAFRPTGWTYSEKSGSDLNLIKPTSRGAVTIYGVPYSEHSSFTELQEFVKFLRPDKLIPTVNIGNASSREKMQSHFNQWLK